MKLNEGETHQFQVIKQVHIPDEGDFFMLRHESGRRLLLPCETYKNFNIKVGNSIDCRIDKVSCSGKVYLEPKHPIYNEGEVYDFEILGEEEQGYARYLTVFDCFGSSVRVALPSTDSLIEITGDKFIKLKVIRLKKGVPILEPLFASNENDAKDEFIGKNISFKVAELKHNDENEKVFVLISNNGLNAELKYKHYKNYGFNVGDSINCDIYSKAFGRLYKVEPENPVYKVGYTYDFSVGKPTDYDDFADDDQTTLVVTDVLGNKCGINVSPEQYRELKHTTRLNCRVVGFRKGRPRLELV